MAKATANQVSLRFSEETAWGETPSGPAMTEVRVTSENLAHNKQTVTSREVRSDRMRADILEVGQGARGDINFELAYGDFEKFLEGVFSSTITSTVFSNASVTVAASTITAPAGSDFTVLFKAGQHVRLHGASATANNQAVARVSALTSTVLTTAGTTLAAEVTSATVNGRMLRNGTTEKSYLIEANFQDITAVKHFNGMIPDGLQVDVRSQQVVTGVFSFLGKAGTAASVTVASTVATSTANVPMTAAVNIGDLFENKTKLATNLTAVQMNMTGNNRIQNAVGQKAAVGVGQGGFDVTGQITAYFEDITLYDKMIQHTESSLSLPLKDTDGNVIVITVPSLYYSAGDPVMTGVDTDIFASLNFTARRDATSDTMMQVDLLPATP